MGSGHSTDDFEPSFERLRHNKYFQHATRVAFPIGKNPDKETLARLTGSSEMVIRTDRLKVFADALSYSCYPPSLSYDSFIDDLWETYVPEDSRGTHPLALTRQMVLGQIKGSLGKGVSHGTLTDALARALLERGEDALRDSHLFLSFVLDYADYDSTSVRVLEHVCDEFLLALYVRQLKGELDATQAAAQASRYLERECLIQPKVAQDVAQEIADAVVAHRSHVI